MVSQTTFSAGILGVEGYVITVEALVDDDGLPGLTIAGQTRCPGVLSGATNEARERVRAALRTCGHALRDRNQVVGLAPSDRYRHDSPGCDLAIACALLAAHGVIPSLSSTLVWGELALDGSVRPATGTLVVAETARKAGLSRLIVAADSAHEAALIHGLEIIAARSLAELISQLRGELPLERVPSETGPAPAIKFEGLPDLSDVRGLALPRKALEIMLAGGHNMLLVGPQGVGKSMLARRIPSLLPALDSEDALEVTKIHGVARRQIPEGLIVRPPIRMPHHTVSVAGLLGGGDPPRPGEVSLAHRGVLFLDDLHEFSRACLEGLRESIEDGVVSIVGARYVVQFPARFQFLAAMSACPCGFLGHPERVCTDSPGAIQRHRDRVASLLGCFDLTVEAKPLTREDAATPVESSFAVRERITLARQRQAARLEGTHWERNADVRFEHAEPMTREAQKWMREHVMQLGTRRVRALRCVARTIADLQPKTIEKICVEHLECALDVCSAVRF